MTTGLAAELAAAGVVRGTPLALASGPAVVGLAWPGGAREVPGAAADVVAALAGLDPRWTWWTSRETAAPLVAAGVRPRTCWDLGAVGRLLHGLRRDDPGAVWAASRGMSEPDRLRGQIHLFDVEGEDGSALRPDGQLSREWLRGGWRLEPGRWAALALEVQARQAVELRAVPDPRAATRGGPLALLTALAESAAALLAVELAADGLPLDTAVAGALLTDVVGPRPASPEDEQAQRRVRDAEVLRHFPGGAVDLRSPLQVKELLGWVGLVLPDTRSWRLDPHAATSPGVAALLRWRKAERTATTYGWGWLDRHVGPDGRLRGEWQAADGASGRMTASAGLHNLPAELRPAVRAVEGCSFVRADLGQIEPRVLAAVSGDVGLARAAREEDMYAPVAAALGCDRPTAKVAVLAAMYGQTSGTAGAALKDLDRAYPVAMAYLRRAEEAGRLGTDLRTYGGRLLRLSRAESSVRSQATPEPDGGLQRPAGHGRFARNAVVQGAAAELFKAWAGTVRDGLRPLGGAVVLCLHDELLLHVPTAQADAAAQLLVDALGATAHWWAAGSDVRFVADVSVVQSWAEAT
ncbi:bifunctional 3'-5' exonuclease/DNA polymerase [soil metagenome]